MSTDPIKYTKLISFDRPTVYPNYERTVQVPGTGNPYLRNPYQDVPSIPPLPPKQGHKWLLVTLFILSCLVVVLGTTLLAVLLGGSQPSSTQSTSARPYDAKAIIHDFQAHGLPLDQLQYGATINDYVGKDYVTVITLQSSAMFIDPSFCNGPCGVGSVWLGVYNSPVDAQSEDNHLVAYRDGEQQQGMPVGTLSALVQTGRCVLIGELATSEYVAILRSDCT
jgi:hypothetical protein